MQTILLQYNAATLQLQANTIGGTLLHEFQPEDIPQWHEELLTMLATDFVDVLSGTSPTAVAADGRACSLQDFQQHYGANYLGMWQMALMRSVNVALIIQAKVVNNENYSALLQAILPDHNFARWQKATQPERFPKEATFLAYSKAFLKFIPAHLWPYEPMLATRRPQGQSWMQIYMGNHDPMYRTSFRVKLANALEYLLDRTAVEWGNDFPHRIIFAYRISCLDDSWRSNNTAGFLTTEGSRKRHCALTSQHRSTAPLIALLDDRREVLWSLNSLWTPCTPGATNKPLVTLAPDIVAPKLWINYPAGMIHSITLEDEEGDEVPDALSSIVGRRACKGPRRLFVWAEAP